MANVIKALFGAKSPTPAPSDAGEDDFADFAEAPAPAPAPAVVSSHTDSEPSIAAAVTASGTATSAVPIPGIDATSRLGNPNTSPVVYTKWYRIWERSSPKDFYSEAVILPFMLLIIYCHFWGRRTNRKKAQVWLAAHLPFLDSEYAQVGFSTAAGNGGIRKSDDLDSTISFPNEYLRERSLQEYTSYASGRQNVAFTDVKMTMYKRFNPVIWAVEYFMSIMLDSIKPPIEQVELTTYPFDGREEELVPQRSESLTLPMEQVPVQTKPGTPSSGKGRPSSTSAYDGFVWAVVHKEVMKGLRDDRYDLSLTSTKEHARLPAWLVVMSESAEITETMLTAELVAGLQAAGDSFRYLIITDQPSDKPLSVKEATPNKRLSLTLAIPADSTASAYKKTKPLFETFIRMPDRLASQAHFRPEVSRKLKAVRDEEQKKIAKASDADLVEERRREAEKKKKESRDTRMRGMTADEQRKFLEKERERDSKRGERKMARKA